MNDEIVYEVSDFVAIFNQTVEYAYPSVAIVGELANFRVSKNKWIYFDLKDQMSSVRFFGTVYNLPGPIEDGMLLQVRGIPRLHPQFGFSLTIVSIQPVGKGTIQKAAALLEAKLEAEGLFRSERKRVLPFPPQRVGLIASAESAAFADFTKIINARWQGLEIELIDVVVQGEQAPGQIVAAIQRFNEKADLPDVLVIVRGGGSAEDLATFSTEQVTRAVAASKAPTLVAIGHEIDTSLAERAADRHASTPSNAAELLVPDRHAEQKKLQYIRSQLMQLLHTILVQQNSDLVATSTMLRQLMQYQVSQSQQRLVAKRDLLEAFNPRSVLGRGYAIVRHEGLVVRTKGQVECGDSLTIELAHGNIAATVQTGKVQ